MEIALNNLMNKNMSAARVASLFREPQIRTVAASSNQEDQQESTPAKELYIARQREVISQLMAAITRLPLGSKARQILETDLSYAQSLRPEQLTPEFFNASLDAARDVLADGVLNGDGSDLHDLEAYSYYEGILENISQKALWNDYYATDFDNNPYTYDGFVTDIDDFAKHYGFDANFLRATNEPFKDDPAVYNNANMQGLRGTIAKANSAYLDSPGKTPADIAGNDHVGLMGMLKYGSREAIDKALKTLEASYGYDEKTGAKSLNPAVKADFYRLRSLIRDGHLTPDEIQAAFDKKSFNNPDFIKATIEAGEDRRMAATKAVSVFIPDAVKEKLLAEAKAKGIDISQPFEKIMEEARKVARTPDGSDVPYKEQNSSLRAALSVAKGAIEEHRGTRIFGEVVELMDKKLTPAERDTYYYNKTPEERLKLFADLYQNEYKQPMPAAVRNAVQYNIDHIRTPAETGAFMAAQKLSAEEKSPRAIMVYYTAQAEKVLAENLANGNQAAQKDLTNLRAIDKHLETVAKDNAELAERLRGKILVAGYQQVTQGRVDYTEIAKVIEKETAVFLAEKEKLAAKGVISERAEERVLKAAGKANTLKEAVQDTTGIKLPDDARKAAAAAGQQANASGVGTVNPENAPHHVSVSANGNGRVAGRV